MPLLRRMVEQIDKSHTMKRTFFNLTKVGVVISAICLLLASCDGLLPKKIADDNSEDEEYYDGSDIADGQEEVTPDRFQSDIDDYVRFEVSLWNMIIDASGKFYKYSSTQEQYERKVDQYADYIDKFETEVLDQWEAGDDDIQTILKGIAGAYSNPYYEVAQKLFKYYNKASIRLSNYEVVSSDSDKTIWEFTEQITGVVIHFTWYEQLNQWHIDPDDASVEEYVEEKMKKFVL